MSGGADARGPQAHGSGSAAGAGGGAGVGDREVPAPAAAATRGGAVLVVGSVNEDVVLAVARRPGGGETVSAERVSRRPGGKGANQAVAAARAGARVAMIGRVGEDPVGERMLADLADAGVDTALVAALPDVATGAAYITVSDDGENTIVVDPGANAMLTADRLADHAAAFGRAAVMLAQLEVPVATVTEAVRLAVAAGARPVVTLSPALDVPGELLAGLDPLLVNEHEAAFLLGHAAGGEDAERAIGMLLGRGPRSVVVTLGADGAVFADREHDPVRLPAPPVERVVDTTGAGDAFAGALAAALAAGAPLAEAVRAGLAAGAAAVGSAGAR